MLDADYAFLNERLARHYGIPNVYGPQYRKVSLPPGSPRGGLLGQGRNRSGRAQQQRRQHEAGQTSGPGFDRRGHPGIITQAF